MAGVLVSVILCLESWDTCGPSVSHLIVFVWHSPTAVAFVKWNRVEVIEGPEYDPSDARRYTNTHLFMLPLSSSGY